MEIEENTAGSDISYISFNREGSRLAIGTQEGFKIYQTNSRKRYPLAALYQSGAQTNPCGLVKVLGESHLFVWVGTGEDPSNSQRKLNIEIAKNDKRRTYPHYFLTPILDVKLEQSEGSITTMIVVLETKFHIYDIREKVTLIAQIDVNPNPKGLCDLSVYEGKRILAYPKNALTSNEIVIYNIDSAQIVCIIQPVNIDLISTLSFDRLGNNLGVVDQYGCKIEIFNSSGDTWNRTYLFKRGTTSSIIRSIAFNNDSTYLVTSSDSATIHIFKLSQPEGWRAMVTESQVSCARVPKTKGEKVICSFHKSERNKLIVASESGKIIYYSINEGEEPEKGQEFDCKLA